MYIGMYNKSLKIILRTTVTFEGYISVDSTHPYVFDVCRWGSWRTYDVTPPKPRFRRGNMHIANNFIIRSVTALYEAGWYLFSVSPNIIAQHKQMKYEYEVLRNRVTIPLQHWRTVAKCVKRYLLIFSTL